MAHGGGAPREGPADRRGELGPAAESRGPGQRPGTPGTIRAMLVSIAPRIERPNWLRAPAPVGENYRDLKGLVERLRLHTVCESAACPDRKSTRLNSSHLVISYAV